MAEGLFRDLFEDEPEGDGEAAPLAAPVLATGIAHADANGSPESRAYLQDARRLIELQIETLVEERILNLRHMKARRWRDGFQLAFQCLGVLIASVIGLATAILVHDALTSRQVVVEAFGAPPALADRGLSGIAVAEGVLDQLTSLQAATRSYALKRHLANAWTEDLKVELPETGIAIGDLDRMLRSRFGHDQHIAGDLVQDATGRLELTVRGDGILPRSFSGGAGDLAKLQVQAAEYIYGQAEPGLFAAYLYTSGRSKEAIEFAKSAYASDEGADRPYLLNAWVVGLQNTGAPTRDTLPLLEAALKLKPDYWTAYNNLMNTHMMLGEEEQAWRVGQDLLRVAGGRPGKAPETNYQNPDLLTWDVSRFRAETFEDLTSHEGLGGNSSSSRITLADADQRLHDPTSAELDLETVGADPNDPTIAAVTHFVRGQIAAEAGDVKRAADELEAFGAAFADPIVSSNYPGYNCWIAPAEEAAGRPAKADAVLKAGGSFVDCGRFAADIADHRGDWKEAQAKYAAAVALAPDLPAAYYSWGLALARHGDLAGAELKLAAAHARGPHWAEPLKALGDLAARQGRRREALASYDQALKLAPAWAELKQARLKAAHLAS